MPSYRTTYQDKENARLNLSMPRKYCYDPALDEISVAHPAITMVDSTLRVQEPSVQCQDEQYDEWMDLAISDAEDP